MGQLIDELFEVDVERNLFWVEAEFDCTLEVDEAATRIEARGWIHDLSVYRPSTDAKPVGPLPSVRKITTMGCQAVMSAPDLEEAVWRLKVLLRSLGLMAGSKGLTALSVCQVDDDTLTLRQLVRMSEGHGRVD